MKRISLILVGIAFLAMMQSCSVSQQLSHGKMIKTSSDKLYYDPGKTPVYTYEDHVKTYNLKNPKVLDLNGKKHKAIIYPSKDESLLLRLKNHDSTTTDNNNVFVFGTKDNIKKDGVSLKNNVGKYVDITYSTRKFSYQAITVPMKIRLGKDSVSYTVSTGFNAGFSFGYKFSRTKQTFYKLDKKAAIDNMTRTFSVTPSAFIGLTPVGLKKSNTENLDTEKTVVGFTYGVGAVAGYDRFNIGLFLGFDVPFGSDGDSWIYKNDPWFGLVVALDFVK